MLQTKQAQTNAVLCFPCHHKPRQNAITSMANDESIMGLPLPLRDQMLQQRWLLGVAGSGQAKLETGGQGDREGQSRGWGSAIQVMMLVMVMRGIREVRRRARRG
jgi:hypothetical protein